MIATLSLYALGKALGWTMIHSFWEGLLIAVLVIGFSHRRSSEYRYIVQCLGLAGLLAAVLVTFGMEMRVNLASARSFEAMQSVRATEQASGVYQIFTRAPFEGPTGFNWDRLAAGLASLWIAGFVIMSVRAGLAAWRVRSLRRSATKWENHSWQLKMRLWAKELGIRRSVRLCLTAFNDVPAVIGHFKPVILLPAAIVTRLSTEQLEAIVLHELMHIRRNDYVVNILQLICETVLFFHPLAWWFSSCIREEREHCCDAQVANRESSPLPYAKALLALEELRVNSPGILALGAGGGSLTRRIKRLLSPPQHSPRIGSWALPVCTFAVILFLGFNLWPKALAQPQSERSLFQIQMVVSEGGEEVPSAEPNRLGKFRVAKEIILNETHVKSAQAQKDPLNGWQVFISLNNEGAERFAKATRDNIGKQAAIIVNQQIVAAPRINEPITGGALAISGNFGEQEARDLARKLTSGSSADEKKVPSIKLQSFFIEMMEDPSRHFTLATKLDSASTDISAWHLTGQEATELVAQAQQLPGVKVLSPPTITTQSGKATRVEMGDVPDKEAIFSVNAKGFITTKDPSNQSEPALIGQSIELLPELGRDNLIIAGKFLNREKVSAQNGNSLVRTSHSAPFYLNLPRTGSFALEQKSKTDPNKYLLFVVFSEISD